MMKRLSMVFASALLAGCGGNLGMIEPVRYDFGVLAGEGPRAAIPLVAVEVRTASWLATPDMHFRLAYAEPLRRRNYTESRWVAPPGELLENFLSRRMVSDRTGPRGTGCRLLLVLDELEQRFESEKTSRVVLAARAQLSLPRGAEILAGRTFPIGTPGGGGDARSGAAAARDAVKVLGDELADWLAGLAHEKPAIAERCRT